VNPPSVLLDHSFLAAVVDPDDPNHDDAAATFAALIDDFLAQKCLLVARRDHLSQLGRNDLFAAVDKLHVARQHRNAAALVVDRTGVDLDEAITLVMIHRCRIRTVMTFTDYAVTLPTRVSTNTFGDRLLATTHAGDLASEGA
jgi:predicted nucleic acid-binding protein